MNKRRYWLWRAVDQDGTVLDSLVQSRRDQLAAERFLHRVLDAEDGVEPRVIVTDKLASYVPAIKTRVDYDGPPTPQTSEQQGREFGSAGSQTRACDAVIHVA